jgi:tetratricopeptide (TPR) repeat protein
LLGKGVLNMLTIKKKGQLANQTQEQKIKTITLRTTEFLDKHGKHLIIAASVLLAMLVIGGAYFIKRSVDERKAGPLLAAAVQVYTLPEASVTDYEKALELFRGVREAYSGTMNADIAHYYIGNCLVNIGRPDEALKEYQDFVDSRSGEKFLLSLVYQRMGYLYSMLGKQAEAITAFEKAESVGGPGVATFELARLYESSGHAVKSQQKYKVVQDELGGTTWSGEAMGKVQAIQPAPQPGAAGGEK